MTETAKTAFDFHGFHSLREYEAECAPAPTPALEIVEDGTDFPQFSLLSM